MRRSILVLAIITCLTAPSFCHAQTYAAMQSSYYSYTAFDAGPNTSLMQASDGFLYGIYNPITVNGTNAFAIYRYTTTVEGFPDISAGLTVLHTQTGTDGDTGLYNSIIEGTDGNFYGTMNGGGANNYGAIFKITPAGQFSIFYSFCSVSFCADGEEPISIVVGTDGNFYGTTSGGGTSTGGVYSGNNGTVFKLTPSGKLTTLHSFCSMTNCTDGDIPSGGLVEAIDGNFYGTTEYGGTNAPPSGSFGAGVLYRITASGSYSAIYDFCVELYCSDGYSPYPNTLIQFTDGTLYGTAPTGEQGQSDGATILFSISTAGVETSYIYFCDDGDTGGCELNGGVPYTPLWLGSDGDLYSAVQGSQGGPDTEEDGGVENVSLGNELPPPGYYFCQQTDCVYDAGPSGAVIQGADGLFYGITPGEDTSSEYGTGIYAIEFYRNSVPLSPPIVLTASTNNVALGQSTTLSWQVKNAGSKTMQVCEAYLNGTPVEAVPLTGSYVYKPTALGTSTASITCGGIETGIIRIVTTSSPTPTTTSLSGTTSVAAGGTATLTATVTKQNSVAGIPSGSVAFKVGSTEIGRAPVNFTGVATLAEATTTVAAGSYPVVATYEGDGGDSVSSSAALPIKVTKEPTYVSFVATANPVPAGQECKLTATVAEEAGSPGLTPTGTVTFSYNGETLATENLVDGIATDVASTSGLAAGTYSLTATYSGDSQNIASSITIPVTVE